MCCLSVISNFLSLLVFCNIRNGRKVATVCLLIPLLLWRCLVCLLVFRCLSVIKYVEQKNSLLFTIFVEFYAIMVAIQCIRCNWSHGKDIQSCEYQKEIDFTELQVSEWGNNNHNPKLKNIFKLGFQTQI